MSRKPITINPRHVYKASFDSGDADTVVIPSHADIVFDSNEWTEKTSGVSHDLNSIDHDVASGITMACGDNGTILKSVNAGDTWSDISPGGLTLSLRTVKKWNNYWFCVGYGNGSTAATILRSDDDGATWDSIDTTTPSYLVTIGFSKDRIIFGGWDHPFSTSSALTIYSDDGLTFTRNTITSQAAIYGVAYNLSTEQFAFCGSGPDVADDTPYFALSDDGLTHVEYETNHTYSIWAVLWTGRNWLTCAGWNGGIKLSATGRAWFDSQNAVDLTSKYIWRATNDFQGNIVITGGDWSTTGFILKSLDHGQTFKQVYTKASITQDLIRKAALVAGHWVAVGLQGFIVKSGIAEAAIYSGALINLSSVSQRLSPLKANATVGAMSFGFADVDKAFTRLLNHQIRNGHGLRGKRLQHWKGVRGDSWPDDFELSATQQFHSRIAWRDGAYYFETQDVQRAIDDYIFEQKTTTLLADANWWDITLSFSTALNTTLVQHDSNFSDAPNALVAYVEIDGEIIRLTSLGTTANVANETSTTNGATTAESTTLNLVDASDFRSLGWGYIDNGGTDLPIRWTGKTANQLTGVTGITAAVDSGRNVYDSVGRGVLNTKPKTHIVDTDRVAANRTGVKEYHYYELNPLKFAYALQTGTFYGTSDDLPPHCQLGIAGQWISTSNWIKYIDLWNPSDETVGPVFRFEGLKKQNAKKFIEEQLLFWVDCFPPILPSGELSLRRMTRVLHDSPFTGILDESNIISVDNFYYDLDALANRVSIPWNFNARDDDYTRDYKLEETDSLAAWGSNKELIIPARGIHGSRFSQALLLHHFEAIIDGYASPPLIIELTLDYTQAGIKVGDIKRVQLSKIPEFTQLAGDFEQLDMSMRIDAVDTDDENGRVRVKCFGSTKAAVPLSGQDNTVMPDTYYGSAGGGTDLTTVTTGSWSAGVGSTWTVTGSNNITGHASLNHANASFYLDGDLVIDSAASITWSDNIRLRCKSFTDNGQFNSVGGGIAASANGTAGGVGNTKAGAGANSSGGSGAIVWAFSVIESPTVEGVNPSVPATISLQRIDATTIGGLPDDLRGSSGATGNAIAGAVTAAGGAGGAGGGGACIITRSFSQGANGTINTSGADGSIGSRAAAASGVYVAGGSGGGGAPGGLLIVLDGGLSTVTDTDQFVATQGDSPAQPNQLIIPTEVPPRLNIDNYPDGSTLVMAPLGFPPTEQNQSMIRVAYIPDDETIEEDTPSEAALPTGINFQDGATTTVSVNWYWLEVSVDVPSDANYRGAKIYVANYAGEWREVGEVSGTNEVLVPVRIGSGTQYFKAHSISNSEIESTDFIEAQYTANGSQTTIIEPGSNLVGNADLSGNAADETLVPNGFFDTPLDGTWVLTEGTAPTTTPTIGDDVTENHYLNLPENAANGYAYGSKTFRLIPGMQYRFRIRAKHDGGAGTDDGFYFRLQYADTFIEPITSANRDGFNDFIGGAETVLTNAYATHEFDYVALAGANWGNIALYNYTQSTVGFQVVFVDVIPMGLALSANDVSFNVGDDTWENQGIQMQYNSGTPRMYVGNGAQKFMKFDGTDLVLGEQSDLRGASDYNDTSLFVHIPVWLTLDGLNITTVGGGAVAVNPGGTTGSIVCTISTGATDRAVFALNASRRLTAHSWTNNRKFKHVMQRTILANVDLTLGTGASTHGFGFRKLAGSGWETWSDSTATTATSISTPSSGDVLEAILDHTTSPKEIRFYVNGSLVATHTTNVPTTGITNAHTLCFADIQATAANGGGSSIDVGEFKYLEGY